MPDDSSFLTREEHQHLADELRATEARMRELCDLTTDIYGPNHRVSFSFQKLLDALGRLMADLQVQAGHDSPQTDGEGPYV